MYYLLFIIYVLFIILFMLDAKRVTNFAIEWIILWFGILGY